MKNAVPERQSELQAVVGEIECAVDALAAMVGSTDDDGDALRRAEMALATACGVISAHRFAMEDPFREERFGDDGRAF